MYASDYRTRARAVLAGNWLLSTLTALIAGLLGGALYGGGSVNINVDQETLDILRFPNIPYEWQRILTTALMIIVLLGVISALIAFLIGGTVRLGHCKYLLDQQDGNELKVESLFSQFHQYGNGFCLALLTSIYTVLWTMLFIIPGIIASYRYAMAPFIQAEHPEYTASESIAASKQMMNGHKWDLFSLDLSFIGWALLCVFTLGIGSMFLSAYASAAHAVFYRNLCAEIPPEPANPIPGLAE